MPSPNIVIFNDTHGWHSQRLVDALAIYRVKVILADLADCMIDFDSSNGLFIPGLNGRLPDAVIVRGIASGTLEQITLRMDVLHTLAELNIPVLNTAKAIEHTVDKARTSLRLHLAGINTPRTWACENINKAHDLARRQLKQGHTLVLKPLFGCQGKGIERITTLSELEHQAPVGGAFYLQHYIAPFTPNQWQDWRLMVIDDKVAAAMSRHSNHWITNFAQGADCLAATVNKEMTKLALDAAKSVDAAYAGVDIIRTQDGHYTVLEVNSVPAWKGLQQATGIDIAAQLAKAIINRLTQSKLTEHAQH
ncbi:MAG: tetrahydromethanopterin:alpha-L-glutamate ligase [Methylophagaceae bacterium]|jgi:tetrahydromethanopterin:alpha-L-glutamate ligase